MLSYHFLPIPHPARGVLLEAGSLPASSASLTDRPPETQAQPGPLPSPTPRGSRAMGWVDARTVGSTSFHQILAGCTRCPPSAPRAAGRATGPVCLRALRFQFVLSPRGGISPALPAHRRRSEGFRCFPKGDEAARQAPPGPARPPPVSAPGTSRCLCPARPSPSSPLFPAPLPCPLCATLHPPLFYVDNSCPFFSTRIPCPLSGEACHS